MKKPNITGIKSPSSSISQAEQISLNLQSSAGKGGSIILILTKQKSTGARSKKYQYSKIFKSMAKNGPSLLKLWAAIEQAMISKIGISQ